MQGYRVKPADVGVKTPALAPQVVTVLRALGLVRGQPKGVDSIAEILDARYGTSSSGRWKKLLGGEYGHAMGLLVQADSAFRASPSYWLSHQNSFNQTLFLALQGHLARIGATGVVATKRQSGELIDYGVTLDPSNAFSTAYASIAGPFRATNVRRNRLPGSHPYEKKSAVQTKYLSSAERNKLVSLLKTAYADLIALSPK
jgi:hypothetical protein